MDSPGFVALGDLDRDGDLDIVSANSGSNSAGGNPFGNITIFLQGPAAGTFPTRITIDPAFGSFLSRPQALALGDLDGDGDVDIGTANSVSNNLTIFLQGEGTTFPSIPSSILSDASTMQLPTSLAFADLDDDGDLDVISANSTSDNVTGFRRTAPGIFASPPFFNFAPGTAVLNDPSSVRVDDVDGDGTGDIIVTGSSTGTTLILKRTLQ
jgi:hypothetical protein